MSKHKSDQNSDNTEAEQSPEMLTHPSYEELMQQLDGAEKKVGEHWDRILRMQAEADNQKRRAERDVENAYKYSIEKIVNELLPVVDSLELCLTSVPADMQKAAASVIEGVNMTLKLFYAALEKSGVKQVNPLNEPFNPDCQQAIAAEATDAVAPGVVISVLQKGYLLNERAIRPALVVVSKAKE